MRERISRQSPLLVEALGIVDHWHDPSPKGETRDQTMDRKHRRLVAIAGTLSPTEHAALVSRMDVETDRIMGKVDNKIDSLFAEAAAGH